MIAQIEDCLPTQRVKGGPQAIGKSRGGWNASILMLAADARTEVTCLLSSGQSHNAPEVSRARIGILGLGWRFDLK